MAVERNLILVHTPGDQDLQDFQDIARLVREPAPDIEVFIASNEIPSSVTRRHAAKRPTLIFSPGRLLQFRPVRGKIYSGAPIPKLEQIVRFVAAGVPVPATAEITPDIVLPEATFGSHVVVKPGFSQASHGHHMVLRRREAVRFQPRDAYPPDHPGRYAPMFVQQFVDTGPFVNHHRVLTLFGAPLLAFKTSSAEPAACSRFSRRRARHHPREGTASRRAGRARADLRPRHSGAGAARLFPPCRKSRCRALTSSERRDRGGCSCWRPIRAENTWIFSKGDMTERLKTALGVARLTDQFDAFAVAAKVLIERARAEAE